MWRRQVDHDEDDNPSADLTPLIDLIFLLLIFLILTIKFVPDEKMIDQMLPAKGSGVDLSLEPPLEVVITILPAALPRQANRATVSAWLDDPHGDVRVRCAGADIILAQDGDPEAKLAKLTTFITERLEHFEQDAARRSDQAPVRVHGYSGLAWRYLLWVFDAVRAYEKDHGQVEVASRHDKGRECSFNAPPLRQEDNEHLISELIDLTRQ